MMERDRIKQYLIDVFWVVNNKKTIKTMNLFGKTRFFFNKLGTFKEIFGQTLIFCSFTSCIEINVKIDI